uniref:Flagellar motor switch protein FliN n=2 Tax=Ralstonia syzygii TaxID=28097 RepID=G3A8P8_9RALS|nr:flagellar motor switching and energizing component. fliN/mopA/spaO family [Ralstonia syzygii R24]
MAANLPRSQKMTSESTQPDQTASADDFDTEMTMEEAMALEAAQRAAAAPAPASAPVNDINSVFKPLVVDDKKPTPTQRNDIDMILDIPVQLTVELGRTKVPIKNLLQLAQGSVVELDALAGEPMDVLVNGYLIAQGEVVVVNEKFGIRLTDIITPSERIRKLNR